MDQRNSTLREPLQLSVVSDSSALGELRPEWEELLSQSDARSLFLTWEWLFSWWEHVAPKRDLHVVCLRSDGKLVAVLPLARRRARAALFVRYPCLEFLGTGVAGSDYLDVIVRRGFEDEALSCLVEHLARAGHALDLRRVRADNALAQGLAASLCEQGFGLRRTPDGSCPTVSLAGHTWDSFLAGLGREHRYNWRRRLRKLAGEHTLELHLVNSEMERGRGLGDLIALHRERFRTRVRSEAFASRELVAFHEAVTRRCLERGWLRLYLLLLDGRPVAGLYGFVYDRRFYFYQSGFDPAMAAASPGLVTMGLAIRAAIEEGVREYDLLHGEESYKRLWADGARDLVRLELVPPGRMGALWRSATGLERAARRSLRRALEDALSGARGFAAWWRRGPREREHVARAH